MVRVAAYTRARREYEDGRKESGAWKSCGTAASANFSAALVSGIMSVTLKIGSDDYDFDVAEMKQINHRTGYVRWLRTVPTDASWCASAATLCTVCRRFCVIKHAQNKFRDRFYLLVCSSRDLT